MTVIWDALVSWFLCHSFRYVCTCYGTQQVGGVLEAPGLCVTRHDVLHIYVAFCSFLSSIPSTIIIFIQQGPWYPPWVV
jgi:hypothetical protein